MNGVVQDLQLAIAPTRGKGLIVDPHLSGWLANALAQRTVLRLNQGLLDLADADLSRAITSLDASGDAAGPHTRSVDWAEGCVMLAQERYTELAGLVEQRASSWLYANSSANLGEYRRQAAIGLLDASRAEPGHLDEAIALFQFAFEHDRSEIERGRSAAGLTEAYLLKGDEEIAEEWLTRARDLLSGSGSGQGSAQLELAAVESVFARTFQRDRLGQATARLEEAFLAWYQAWAQRPLRPGGYGNQQFLEGRRVVSELIQMKLEDGAPRGAERALGVVLQVHAIHSLARRIRGTAKAPSLESVRRALTDADTGVAVYFPGTDRSHLFLIDSESVEHHELQPTDSLRRRIREGRLKDGQALLPKSAGQHVAGWRGVTVVGLRLFGRASFEGFRLGDGSAARDVLDVAYLPSTALGVGLAERRSKRPQAGTGTLIVAAPRPPEDYPKSAGSLSDLPIERAQVRATLGATEAGPCEILFADEATRTNLKARLDSNEKVGSLFMVGHAIRDNSVERSSTLVLHGTTYHEARIGYRDVQDLSAPPLVALMACGTGAGPTRTGDAGAADLGGAFMEAGADCVLLSPYPIEFHAALPVFSAFRKAIAAGESPARALRNALARCPEEQRAKLRGLHVFGLGQTVL